MKKADDITKKRRIGFAGLLIFSLAMTAEGSAYKEKAAPRNFVLMFEVLDYSRELGDAIAYFFNRVLEPGDQLIIYSPARAYGYSKMTLTKPKGELIAAIQNNIRSDIAACSTDYKDIINNMKTQVTAIEGGDTATDDSRNSLKISLTMYRQDLTNMTMLRKINESLLLQIVKMFKTQQGKNHIVMFYGAEFRPIPDTETINRMRDFPSLAFEASELFVSDIQKVPLDADRFIEIFNETPITLHFLYIQPKRPSTSQNYKEHSVDMYGVFTKIATDTGGIVETTANPEAALKSLVRALNESTK